MSTEDRPTSDGAADGPTGSRADETDLVNDRFIHGLLGFLHTDTAARQEDRINAVLDRLDKDGAGQQRRLHRFFSRLAPVAIAATLTIATVTVFFVSMQSTAYAMVGDAIRATRLAKQLRYEIRLTDPARNEGQGQIIGKIDMRDDLTRVEIEMPRGRSFISGRDARSAWTVGEDGEVERLDPQASAPRWLNVGESIILVDGIDALLEELRDDEFSIERASVGGGSVQTQGLTELVATRLEGSHAPGADRVHVWIDDATLLVDRLELHWDRRSRLGQRDGPPGGPPRGFGDTPRAREGDRPPPPALIVFQRVPWNDVDDAWFSPPEP